MPPNTIQLTTLLAVESQHLLIPQSDPRNSNNYRVWIRMFQKKDSSLIMDPIKSSSLLVAGAEDAVFFQAFFANMSRDGTTPRWAEEEASEVICSYTIFDC